jgi:hypothetical protein
MQVGVLYSLPSMEISGIVIANVDMLCASLYDPRCDMTKCALIMAIDWERRYVIPAYISAELEQPLRYTGAFGTSYVFGFEG